MVSSKQVDNDTFLVVCFLTLEFVELLECEVECVHSRFLNEP
jgi:hypothetical protein